MNERNSARRFLLDFALLSLRPFLNITMEHFEKITIGIAVSLIVALILYAFKVRQLYLLVPKMFGYGGLTGNGKIVEIRAFNKGRSMEEEVHINMPAGIKHELIASDHPDVDLKSNKVTLSRISPLSEISLILLAEGAAVEAESFTPTITSKATKGKVVKRLEEMPPNIGTIVLTFVGFILIMFAIGAVPSFLNEYQKTKYAFLEKAGWRNIDFYVKSEVRNSYRGNEFPIVITSVNQDRDFYETTFMVINKTALPLRVTAYFDYPKEESRGNGLETIKSSFDVLINPMQAIPMAVSTKLSSDLQRSKLFVSVSLYFGDDWNDHILGLKFLPYASDISNKTLSGNMR